MPPTSFFIEFENPIHPQFAIELMEKTTAGKLAQRSLLHEAMKKIKEAKDDQDLIEYQLQFVSAIIEAGFSTRSYDYKNSMPIDYIIDRSQVSD